jgi:poly-gamma-glutamate synthesis protein (capsule biosynthesis protein)
MLHVGAGQNFRKAYMLKTIEIKGFKVGFLAFCESEFGAYTNKESQKYGYAWINHDLVDEIIKRNRSKVDILILSSHAGVEEMPLPLPEWRSRYKELCDLGVDIIIGHHPHVPQGW